MSWIVTNNAGYSDAWNEKVEELRAHVQSIEHEILASRGVETCLLNSKPIVRVAIAREWENLESGAGAIAVFIGNLENSYISGWFTLYRSREGKIINLHPESSSENPLAYHNLNLGKVEASENIDLGNRLKSSVDNLLNGRDNSQGLVSL